MKEVDLMQARAELQRKLGNEYTVTYYFGDKPYLEVVGSFIIGTFSLKTIVRYCTAHHLLFYVTTYFDNRKPHIIIYKHTAQ